jgi:parvulin-like peptidyl-prolyl isomerase
VPRGVLNPDLEAASFGTPVNQTSVVTTEQGIHLVQTLQVVPTQVVPYQQVAGTLQSSLYTTVLQQRLNLYLQLLRVDADIVSYLG